MFFKKLLYLIAISATKIFGLEYWIFNSDKPGEEDAHYFLGFGRRMLIYRGENIRKVGGSFEITAKRKTNGELIDCKFSRHTLMPGDKIVFGREKVRKKYIELEYEKGYLVR